MSATDNSYPSLSASSSISIHPFSICWWQCVRLGTQEVAHEAATHLRVSDSSSLKGQRWTQRWQDKNKQKTCEIYSTFNLLRPLPTMVLLLLCWRWIREKGIRIHLKKLHLSTHVEPHSSCVVLLNCFTVLPGSLSLIFSDNIWGQCPGSSDFLSEGRFPLRQEENESSCSPGGQNL